MKNIKLVVAAVSISSLLIFSMAPAFAQLGDPVLPPLNPTPPPIVVDLCPNIDGAQASIPSGMIADGSGDCITPIPADTTAPVIAGIASLSLATHDATIVWTTDELSVSTFEYGITESYGSSATLDATALLAHTAILTGLTPGMTYHYCIHAHDLAGNLTNLCGHTFTTASQAIIVDTTPPDIILITVTPITSTGATINFTTTEVGNARVEYGTTAGYGNTTTLDTNLALTHTVALSNLMPNILYHYRIITSDELGNETITSDETFTTALASQNIEVVPSEVILPVISTVDTISVSTSTATIGWTTNVPTDSQIEYGNSENFGFLTTLDSTLTTSHSVALTGLLPNTNYIFRVKSKPTLATVAITSSNYEFNTLSHTIPVVAPANIISVSSGSVTGTGVTITWATDKGATSQVEYGMNTTYGSSSTNGETLATPHSVSLNNLSSGTTYHYRVKSIDEVGNITFSEDYTFTTEGSPSNLSITPPPTIITDEGETPMVDVTGVDGEVVFEINEGNPALNEDVVIERDGQIIYEGNSETFTDTNVTNGVTHSYSVFARSSGGSSRPVTISIAAVAGVTQVKFNESGTLASSTPLFHFVKTFQKGITDIEIEHLQELLHAEGTYPEKYITGYFGTLTEAALMRFQAKHGLAQTGITDTATQTKLNTISMSETKLDIPTDVVVFETDLKHGDQGEAVKDLQQYLIYEGSYIEAIMSGYFGDYTHNAVKKFQATHGITPVSGYVGFKTRHKMQQLVGL